MRIRTGTSGYSYKEWKGSFYPADLPAAEMLRHYSGRLTTVEINNTFYRMPSEKLLVGWAAQVPDGFSFVLKASRRITHQRQLEDCDDALGYLLRTASVLGDKLGPMLFQLPPFLRKDVERLRRFLDLFPRRWRAAFEFRHASWLDDEVHEVLRARDVALVCADTDEDDDAPIVATATYGYVRLRREHYDGPRLDAWLARIRQQPWREAHVFFKHEDAGAGPRLAVELMQRIGAGDDPAGARRKDDGA